MLTPIADAIDPVIAAAIAALQSGSSSNPLSVFDIPGDPATFDRVTRSELPWQVELTNLPLTVPIDDKWPVEDVTQVSTMARPLLLEAIAVLDGAPAPLDISALDSAKRLALLRQDIAAFGGRVGAEQLDWNGNGERALVSMF